MNIALLKEVCETPGVPGHEQKVRELITRELKEVVDQIYTDNMGNLIAVLKGKTSDKKVMAAAHMDEIGFIVHYIDDNGFLRFHPLGGFDPKTLTSQRVVVHGKKDLVGVMGTKPIHLMTPEERTKQLQLSDYFIDLGMKKEEVVKWVEVGNVVTRERELIEIGDCVNCKSIDNRVAVYILIELMRELKGKSIPYDFYGVFTVQEEVGIRGAMVAAHHINAEFSFCIDTTIAFDVPGAKPEEQVTRLGEGVAIKIMDSSAICDYRMVRYMKEQAAKYQIKWQPEILPAGGTDTSGMQRMSTYGTIAGAVSVPTRHIHSVIETAHKGDIQCNIDLLKACILNLEQYNWNFN
ncbi:MAG: M42 family metallopeptidase [Chitinophagales bacterium]|nr:M42 family metallopeptidase [Chitinophagales bacterium]MDW8417933.1 M42 family metallopeptidase [Chitinophagales bacterium]